MRTNVNLQKLRHRILYPAVCCAALVTSSVAAFAQPTVNPIPAPWYTTAEPLGVAMEGWAYPYPLQTLQYEQDGQPLRMMYIDVQAAKPNGQTVLLMHGKNFGADYWANTLRTLSKQGYRVIAPDQIGFDKSSKPEMRYSFEMLAAHTLRLLDALKVDRTVVVANSMGGMLGVHFGRRYPARVSALVLENPLGLEDYRAGIPPQATDNLVKLEMAQTPETY